VKIIIEAISYVIALFCLYPAALHLKRALEISPISFSVKEVGFSQSQNAESK
jgi:hypothetical protein